MEEKYANPYEFQRINYFVHPEFVTKVLPNQSGNNKISFSFNEWILSPQDEEFLNSRTSAGYFYKLQTAQKFADEIVFLPKYEGKTKLENNEVLISIEQAKIILSGYEHRLTQNITDEEAIEAITTGNISSIFLTCDSKELPINARIVGYYSIKDTEWLSWKDENYSSIAAQLIGKMNVQTIAPFIVSDELYNIGKPIATECVGFLINSENIKITPENLKFLAENYSEFYVDMGVYGEFSEFLWTYNHNSTVVKPIWMYIALGTAVLCVIAVLSYVWAVIHDSKRKIGMLRAQGMNNLSIAAIYLLETMAVCIIAIVIGSFLTLVLSNVPMFQGVSLTSLIDFKTNHFGILEILSVCGFGLGVGVLGSSLPIILNARKTPISMIRSKK